MKFNMMIKSAFILFMLAQLSHSGYAQYITGPVSSALGEAGVAANDDAEPLLYNPAVLMHTKDLAMGYYYADGYRDKNEHDKSLGVTITDNTSDLNLAGGVGLFKRRRTFDQFSSLNEWFAQVSLATHLARQFSIGVTIEYFRQEAVGDKDYRQTDANLGFFYNPFPDLGLGLVIRHLGSRDRDIPRPLQLKDEWVAGVNYIVADHFRVRMDIEQQTELNPKERRVYKGGFESMPNNYLILRAGYQLDELERRKYYTLGGGLTGPRLKIDYSYLKNVDYSGGAMHGVDFRIPF